MNYKDGARHPEPPREVLPRPDLVNCPHCRGTGVVLRSKLSAGQLKKIEEPGSLNKNYPVHNPPFAQSKPYESTGRELVLYQRTDRIPGPSGRDPLYSNRNAACSQRVVPPEKDPDYLRSGAGSLRRPMDMSPRQKSYWWGDAEQDNDKWAENRERWVKGGEETWGGGGNAYSDNDNSMSYGDGMLKKKRKRKRRKNDWVDGPNAFRSGDWNPASEPNESFIPPPSTRDLPRGSLMDPMRAPVPLSSSSRSRQLPPRKRARGPNPSYNELPNREDLSEIDIFSLGVLYGNYMT